MKRDLSLIREMLLYLERQPAGAPLSTIEVPEGTDGPTAGEHIQLLIDKGLVEGEVFNAIGPGFVIDRLTWDGHDFLQAIKNETVWRRLVNKSKDLGGAMTLEIAMKLAMGYLSELADIR